MLFITSQQMLAALVGVTPQHLSDVIATRQNCSSRLATELEEYTGISSHLWLPGNEDRCLLKQQLKDFIKDHRCRQAKAYRTAVGVHHSCQN